MNTKPGKKKKIAGIKTAKKSKYDSAWKDVIRQLLDDFLEFFFPAIHQAIDFTKEIAFLDTELKEIDPGSKLGDRIADVLVKVHLKDGSIKYICIIIHIEVQGQPRPNFMEKMFIYYYRAIDKEKKEKIPVISVALLTDENENYRPNEYLFSLFGFELRMKIPIVKILDYKLKRELIEKLETSSNPMSMIVKAQLKSHEVKRSDNEKKYEVTKELIRQCYGHGYSRETTRIIMRFFNWVIRLPDVYKERLKRVIKEVEEEYKMEFVPLWERDARREGIKKGIERGIGRGVVKNAKETAARMLNDGLTLEIISKYTGLSVKDIKKLSSTSH